MSGPDHRLALPDGFRVAEYKIVKVLGQGGFGITYLAHDTHLNIHVAIKEMLPREFATRVEGVTVMPKNESDADNFAWAKHRFSDEAQILAGLRHLNIVQVARFLELNGTAYMVMDFIHGHDFMHWIREHPHPSERDLLAILLPLLDGLKLVHQRKVLHRDISPENILVNEEGRPILIDFGAARSNVSTGRALTGVIRPGYSPVEQYQTDSPQGPSADLYALAAVMIHAVSGQLPPLSLDRCGARDSYQPLAKRYRGKYSADFLHAVDIAFSINPQDRPQSVAEWRQMFPAEAGPEKRKSPPPSPPRKAERRDQRQQATPKPGRRRGLRIFGALVLLIIGIGAFVMRDKIDSLFASGNSPTDNIATPASDPGKVTPPRVTPSLVSSASNPSVTSLSDALSKGRYVNSLGMEFVKIPGTKVMLGVTQVTRRQYGAYAEFTSGIPTEWKNAQARNSIPAGHGPDHPVVMISWSDARSFCKWLSEKDTKSKGFAATYRLPKWEEWRKVRGEAEFPWGDAKTPPKGAGNYADETARAAFGQNFPSIASYNDGFATTSPVKSFNPNSFGLYDFGGNVQEWSADQDVASGEMLVLGASWKDNLDTLSVKNKPLYHEAIDKRRPFVGFRCVISLSGD